MDFAEKYKMPSVRLSEEAIDIISKYYWPGNIRQLRNVTEQLSVVEESRMIGVKVLENYLPKNSNRTLPALYNSGKQPGNDYTEREILYKVLFDMKKDIGDLKKLTQELMKGDENFQENNAQLINKMYNEYDELETSQTILLPSKQSEAPELNTIHVQEVKSKENLSLQEKEIEMIKSSLEKHKGKRKGAANELGISERTLYRKIKQYNL
jgi:transcriptional regulator with PAS, ATPase and Fis domain